MKIDLVVAGYIYDKNKVLLIHHRKLDMWLPVGGHIQKNETPDDALLREIKEEVGLDVVLADGLRPFTKETSGYKELIPPMFLNRNRISDTHEHVTLTYFARAETDRLAILDHEKSAEIKWFTRSDLEKNEYGIKEAIRQYALRALDVLGEK